MLTWLLCVRMWSTWPPPPGDREYLRNESTTCAMSWAGLTAGRGDAGMHPTPVMRRRPCWVAVSRCLSVSLSLSLSVSLVLSLSLSVPMLAAFCCQQTRVRLRGREPNQTGGRQEVAGGWCVEAQGGGRRTPWAASPPWPRRNGSTWTWRESGRGRIWTTQHGHGRQRDCAAVVPMRTIAIAVTWPRPARHCSSIDELGRQCLPMNQQSGVARRGTARSNTRDGVQGLLTDCQTCSRF